MTIHSAAKNNSLDYTGNALPGFIQLQVEGAGWKKTSPEGEEVISTFLAHEAAHLWNSRLFKYERDTVWMHEGGAESLAFSTLKEFGVITDEKYFEIMSQKFNQCLSGLSGISLKDSSKERRFKNYYTCGAIVGFITEAAMKKANPKSSGIIDFWKDLFAKASKNNNVYTQEMYLSLLFEKTNDQELLEGLRKFINEPIRDPGIYLVSLFKKQGVRVIPVTENFSVDNNKKYGSKAMEEIMSCDCNKSYGFWKRDNYLEIDKNKKCENIKSDMFIDRIGGFSILKNGVNAYDLAFKNGQENKPIVLGIYQSKKSVIVNNCKIPARPIIYRLLNLN